MRIATRKEYTQSKIVGFIAGAGAGMNIKEFVALSRASSASASQKILVDISNRFNSPLFLPESLNEAEFTIGLKSSPLSPIEIAECCQYLTSNEDRTRNGVFFTPGWLAEEMANEAVCHKGKVTTILDPACGSGVFLLACLNIIRNTHRYLTLHELQSDLKGKLFGVDLDGISIEFTRILILLSTYETFTDDCKIPVSLNESIIQGNSLESSPNEDVGFDLVIGNPPFGLSRNGCVSKKDAASLKSRYQNLGHGKVNQYMSFIARGYELIKDQGVLSFVTPNSWLGIKDGEMLRKAFLTRGELHSLKVLNPKAFSDVSFEGVTFIIQKGAPTQSIKIQRENPKVVSYIEQLECLRTPLSVIPLTWNDEIAKVLSLIEKNCSPLISEEFCLEPKIALQIYATGKGSPPQTGKIVESHAFHSRAPIGPDSKRYLEGKDLKRFKISWGGDYVEYGPWCAEHQPSARFSQPRVLVREITGKSPYLLNCSFSEEEYFYNRSILHILCSDPDSSVKRKRLISLLGILNSKIASFILLFRGQKSQRTLFPKVLNGDLKAFPLPGNFNEISEALFPIVAKRLNTGDHHLDDDIDYLAFEAYGLPKSMHSVIHSALSDLSFSSSRTRMQSRSQEQRAA